MRPGMGADLVTTLHHCRAFLRPAFDGEARREPRRLDVAVGEKLQDAAAGHPPAELSARKRRRRRHAARDEPGLGVEIEGQTDDVTWHAGTRVASNDSRPSYSATPGACRASMFSLCGRE